MMKFLMRKRNLSKTLDDERFKKIKGKITSILDFDSNHIDASKITPDADFYNDIGMDSLDKYELGYFVEEEFNVSISDEKMQEMKTSRDFLNYIQNYKRE